MVNFGTHTKVRLKLILVCVHLVRPKKVKKTVTHWNEGETSASGQYNY